MSKSELYFSVDIEADGPIPGPFSMSSFGACVAAKLTSDREFKPLPHTAAFYRELKPISDQFQHEAAAVSGLNRAELIATGAKPFDAMEDFVRWVKATADSHSARPIFVAYPAGYDWMWMYWYMVNFAHESPFGFSGMFDCKTSYATKAVVGIGAATKRQMPKHLLSTKKHTHNALDDAIEQAELFCNLMLWEPGITDRPPAPLTFLPDSDPYVDLRP